MSFEALADVQRLSIFPLAGALLFPRMHLPLHIFEPRYRALVSDAMARDRRIGMIQPRAAGDPPPLFRVGCIGRMAQVEALDDEALVNGIAQIAPFDAAAKQALLEANSLAERCDTIVQLLQFFGRHDGENQVTLQ
jgi:Lon protease-like protein